MANLLVLYGTKTGQTAKMAELVAEGAGASWGHEVRLRSVEEAVPEDVLWCDGLALGAPTNMGSIPWRMKKFWDDDMQRHWGKIDGKLGCAFSSMGGWGGGGELNCLALMIVLQNFGFLTFGVTDYVAPQFTLHYGTVQAGEPREPRELEASRRLGRRLSEWAAVMVDGNAEAHPLVNGEKRFAHKD
ncbi:MAG: flavodoxin domain-containing protein [Planctomycetota bacterium]